MIFSPREVYKDFDSDCATTRTRTRLPYLLCLVFKKSKSARTSLFLKFIEISLKVLCPDLLSSCWSTGEQTRTSSSIDKVRLSVESEILLRIWVDVGGGIQSTTRTKRTLSTEIILSPWMMPILMISWWNCVAKDVKRQDKAENKYLKFK